MDRWLLSLTTGYLTVILRGSLPQLETIATLLVLLLVALVAFWQSRNVHNLAHLHTVAGLLLALMLGMMAGALVIVSEISRKEGLAEHFKQSRTLTFTITEIPRQQDDFIQLQGVWQTATRRYLLRLNWYDAPPQVTPRAGQTWRLKVKLRAPQGPRNQGGFFYHRYLLGERIDALGSIDSGVVLESNTQLRQRIYEKLQSLQLESNLAGVVPALLLGERQHLRDEDWFVLQRTGLAHLIAISGLHLALVAAGLFALSRYLLPLFYRRRSQREQANMLPLALLISLSGSLCYAYLAGFATATLRAWLMVAVVLLHKLVRTRTSAGRILLRAGTLVMLLQPLAPLQIGFWLSIGAVAAILLMQWRWTPIQGRLRGLRMLWRLELFLTLALWPLTLMWFGGLAMLAPLTNLLVVPIVSFWTLPLLFFSALSLSFYGLSSWLTEIALWPLEQLWPALTELAEAPWQWLDQSEINSVMLTLMVLVAALLPVALRVRTALIAVTVLGYYIFDTPRLYQPQLVLHILDVEQGSAMVLERYGRALLVDTAVQYQHGGSMAERVILPFLRARKLTPELAFISHTDADHRGGYQVLQQHYPQLSWFGASTQYPCVSGQQGNWQGVRWQVLHPQQVGDNSANNDSCVISFQLDGFTLLYPGDIEQKAEQQLLAQLAPLAATVLVLPHHGSKSSSSRLFLQTVSPQLAVISRGRNNPYKQPHRSVLQRLTELKIQVLDTARGGQISIYTDGYKWTAEQPWQASGRAWFDRDN